MQQYIIYARDGKDEQALDRRMEARPFHFQKASALKAQGHFITGGAMLNEQGQMCGSMMLVQFESREQLQQWLDTEPYITAGVWQQVEVHPFRMADVP